MGDQGQKGVQFLEEAQKKLKNSQGFLSSFFGYVCVSCSKCEFSKTIKNFKISIDTSQIVVVPESMKQSIYMYVLLIHLKWLKNGEVICLFVTCV